MELNACGNGFISCERKCAAEVCFDVKGFLWLGTCKLEEIV